MANDADSSLGGRVDPGSWPLAVGDVVVIVLFLALGTVRHNDVAFLLGNPDHLAMVVVPFLIAWALAAPLLGAYSPGAAESAKAAVPLALRAWLVAAVVGVAVRATPFFPGGFALTFLAVTLVVGAVALGAWRWLFFRLT